MKTILYICAVLLVIFASSIPVHSQGDPLVDDMKTIGGNVVSVDIQNSLMVIKAYEVMTFTVPSDAKIVNADGLDIGLSDVNPGNYVTVDYCDDKSGRHVMKGMEVEYSR